MAQTAEVNRISVIPDCVEYPVKAGEKILQGANWAVDATGHAVLVTKTPGLLIMGPATDTADNTNGEDGDISVKALTNRCYLYKNAGGGDGVTFAHLRQMVYAEDEDTVRNDSDTNTASKLGILYAILPEGPLVYLSPGVQVA